MSVPNPGWASQVPEFSGATAVEVSEFCEALKEAKTLATWNDSQALSVAKMKLRGQARSVSRVDPDIVNATTLDKFCDALKVQFEAACSSELKLQELLTGLQQGEFETVRQFATRIRELASKITLGDTSQQYVSLSSKFAFCRGLKRTIRRLVLSAVTPEMSFSDAVAQAVKEEMNENLSRSDNLSQQLNALQVRDSSRDRSRDKNENQRSSNSRQCYECGSYNHLARQCPKMEIRCFECNSPTHMVKDCFRRRNMQSRGRSPRPQFRSNYANQRRVTFDTRPRSRSFSRSPGRQFRNNQHEQKRGQKPSYGNPYGKRNRYGNQNFRRTSPGRSPHRETFRGRQ